MGTAANDFPMLLIRAKAGPSQIHGLGLIAQEFIPAGTILWRFQEGFDVKIPEAKLAEWSEAAREAIDYYAYFHEASRTYILSSDDDRFTNHSEHPNTMAMEDHMVATRDIQAGEEITSNYDQFRKLNFFPTTAAKQASGDV
jgi:uncharacterized protein